MTTLADRALLDTNILVAALYQDHEHHAGARALVDRTQDGDVDACLAPQVLTEFYAIVTDPRRVTAPLEPAVALAEVEKYLAVATLPLLSVPETVVARWVGLVRRRPVTRGKVHDLHLIATMLENDVHRIYTFNRDDFEVFSELEVLAP